jgi:hypothetical protein
MFSGWSLVMVDGLEVLGVEKMVLNLKNRNYIAERRRNHE